MPTNLPAKIRQVASICRKLQKQAEDAWRSVLDIQSVVLVEIPAEEGREEILHELAATKSAIGRALTDLDESARRLRQLVK